MAKAMRENETREAQSRDNDKRRVWQPHGMTDTPEPPAGWLYRWVRHELRGDDDSSNVIKRMREGYEPVRVDELPEDFVAQTVTDGKHAGVVRNGDLILCKIPVETVQEREQYFRDRTARLQDSVDATLMRHQNEAMPISQDRKSSVSRGQPNFEEE